MCLWRQIIVLLLHEWKTVRDSPFSINDKLQSARVSLKGVCKAIISLFHRKLLQYFKNKHKTLAFQFIGFRVYSWKKNSFPWFILHVVHRGLQVAVELFNWPQTELFSIHNKDKLVLSDLFFCVLTGCLQSEKRSNAKASVSESWKL